MDTPVSFFVLLLSAFFFTGEDLAFVKGEYEFVSLPETQETQNVSEILSQNESQHNLTIGRERNNVDVFPCNRLPPSPVKPTSVHKLRPADINVVAALGDSYTAGKAAGGKTLVSWLFDYRGLSWSIGGDESYVTFQSMPNILRQFSPGLYGFSNGIGNYRNPGAGLNVARDGATSNGLLDEVKTLMHRLKSDPNVNFDGDWKIITLLIGGNDLCRACNTDQYTPETYIINLKQSLDMLQQFVPKVFVNLVEIMPVELVRELHKGPLCNGIHKFYCDCIAYPRSETDFHKIVRERKEYQRLTEELVSSGIYDTKEDFTVVIQPFYRNSKIPKVPGSDDIDYSFFSVDCFHLSKKGQASIGLLLWNNMLQPLGQKTTVWNTTMGVVCPTEDFPYLATRKNSPGSLMHQHNSLTLKEVKHESKHEKEKDQSKKRLNSQKVIPTLERISNSSEEQHGGSVVPVTSTQPGGKIPSDHVDVGLICLITGIVVAGLTIIAVVILLRRRPSGDKRQEEEEPIKRYTTMPVFYTKDTPVWPTELLRF